MAHFRRISRTTPAPSSSEPLFYHMGGNNTPDKSRMVTLRLIPNAASSGSSMSSGSGSAVEYTGGIHTTSAFPHFFIFLYISYVSIQFSGQLVFIHKCTLGRCRDWCGSVVHRAKSLNVKFCLMGYIMKTKYCSFFLPSTCAFFFYLFNCDHNRADYLIILWVLRQTVVLNISLERLLL